MAGHSKWANIQHRKNRQDAKRAKIFTKLVREITVSARLGGADPDANPRLRAALSAAKSASLPNDNIQRAIDRATGDAGGESYEEFTYEGYGPHGVAVLLEGLTDNRNRTAAEIRHLFSRAGGNLAENGAVAWQFSRKGLITMAKGDFDEETATEHMIESGAEDYEELDDAWILTTASDQLHAATDHLESAGFEVKSSEWVMMADNEMELGASEAKTILNMVDAFEDHDDVQKIWTNADYSAAEEDEDEG